MQFQFDISTSTTPRPPQPQLPPAEMVPHLLTQILDQQREMLGQIVELQQQHLHHVRSLAQEHIARWRHILSRSEQNHPQFVDSCKKAFPIIEKAYVQMLATLIEDMAEQGEEALDNEFSLQEFVDRNGMKIGQLTHILGVLGPMVEAAHQNEIARQQQEAVKQQQQPQVQQPQQP